MKHWVNFPHHEVLESMTTPFEVDTEVVHNRDVILDSSGAGRWANQERRLYFGRLTQPHLGVVAAIGLGVFLRRRRRAAEARGGKEQDVRQSLVGQVCLSRKITIERGQTPIGCKIPR